MVFPRGAEGQDKILLISSVNSHTHAHAHTNHAHSARPMSSRRSVRACAAPSPSHRTLRHTSLHVCDVIDYVIHTHGDSESGLIWCFQYSRHSPPQHTHTHTELWEVQDNTEILHTHSLLYIISIYQGCDDTHFTHDEKPDHIQTSIIKWKHLQIMHRNIAPCCSNIISP